MPSSEREGGEPNREEEKPYYQASRYKSERDSRRPYAEAQEAIFSNEYDLSAFRFQLDTVYHVAVLGGKPTETVVQIIERILSSGESVELLEEVLDALLARREQAQQIGPWVEGHYDEQVAPRIQIPKKKQGKRRKR